MNHKAIVKLSNIIGITSIITLVYWVFIFISIEVFGLKIFRENLTQTFYLSVMGILALMFGALIINIMFNLTRIAEKHNQDDVNRTKRVSKKIGFIFLLSFPLVFGLLYGGDYLTSIKKEKMLIASAKSIVENNLSKSNQLVNYSFNKIWIAGTAEILDLYSKTDTHFPYVSVIVSDSVDHSQVYLSFRHYYRGKDDTLQPVKQDFIKETTKEERDYLATVFEKNNHGVRFSAKNGRYELFYPFKKNGRTIVLFFSDYQQYGKMGR
jgi:hypothetical protein